MKEIKIYQAQKNMSEVKTRQVAEMLTDIIKHRSVTSYIFDFTKKNTKEVLSELNVLRIKEFLNTGQTIVVAEKENEVVGVAVVKKDRRFYPIEKVRVYFPRAFKLLIPMLKSINFNRIIRGSSLFNNVKKPTAKYYTLELVGVKEELHGRGIGKKLLEKVEEISGASGVSKGVYLFTAKPENKDIYKYIGYKVISIKRVAGISIYHMFKPNCEV